MGKTYLCIDLKTFFASVECVERGLDPFKVDLVVAAPDRGKGALCLAITPKMKARGIQNRCRLFDIPSDVEYMIARPRMKLYMQYSANIYEIYLKYIAAEDIHVYSIDEAFLDVTSYLKLYELTAKELAKKILEDIFASLGMTATVGIGPNMYLAKVALDIISKHSPDFMGVLTEETYKEQLWHHTPITDFWHIGGGIATRLAKYGVFDMCGLAHMEEKLLYKEFGINAEYIIDHAWGRETTTIKDIKNYKTKSKSVNNSQILFEDYQYEDAFLVMKEMVEINVLGLVEKGYVASTITVFVGYSKDTRKPTGGSLKLPVRTNSYQLLLPYFEYLYQKTTDPTCPIRSIGISFGGIKDEIYETYDLFTDYEALNKEKNLQLALIEIKHKYGKNAVLKGMNLYERATQKKRNTLVGGHNAS